jgi:hypothetical protein
VQFEIAARTNDWDTQMRAAMLACNLKGNAQAFLSDLPTDVRIDYPQLVTALSNRFDPQDQVDLFRAQMKQRLRKKDESFPALAQDIKRLTRLAYPTASLELVDTLALECFVGALNDARMEFHLSQVRPKSVDDAVRLATNYEVNFHNYERRLKNSHPLGLRQQCIDLPNNPIPSPEFEDLTSERLSHIEGLLREMTVNKKQNNDKRKSNDYRNKTCYYCGEIGHLFRSCPALENTRPNTLCDSGNHESSAPHLPKSLLNTGKTGNNPKSENFH